MISGDYAALGRAIAASTATKARLDQLTAQAASGHVSDSLAGLEAGAQTTLDVSPQVSQLQARSSAIDAVSGRLGVTQDALTQINSIATQFNAKLSSLNDITPTQVDSVAVSARTALQQVASLLDTTDGQGYVFGGTDSATPPVPDPENITTSGFYTQIGTAVSGLAANGAAATAASTLATAQSDAPGTTPFSGPPGQTTSMDVGTGAPVQTGLLANANTLAVSGGTSTTVSYIRDILRSLATLSNLSSSQANAPGFAALVTDTGKSLSGAISAMGTEAGALGDIQSSLAAVQTEDANTATVLKTQVSSVQDVDMTKTLSDLTQVQNQLSASYKLISEVNSMSLVQYI